MLLDVLAGRASEVDVINGAIPPLGESSGFRAPVNRTVTALVHAIERTGTAPLVTRRLGIELGEHLAGIAKRLHARGNPA